MIRIMKYYQPFWTAVLSFVISVINSFAFPAFGFVWINLISVISLGTKYPNYDAYRNFWSVVYLILVFLMGLFQFLENMLYQYTGEKLTHDVRKKLFTQILHK